MHDPDRSLFDYRRGEFDLGRAWPAIARCLAEIRDGRGFALLRGLPRDGLTQDQFALLTWAIGLHVGVARPRGKESRYLSAVRDVGTTYRTGGGRGYSSSAELDFHTDSADIVLLTCYRARLLQVDAPHTSRHCERSEAISMIGEIASSLRSSQ